jgi:hypothetical protein
MPAMKGHGSIFRRKGTQFLWCAYSLRGAVHRESTGEIEEDKARRFLRNRLDEVGADRLGLKKFVGPSAERVTVAELLDALESDLELRQLRSLPATKNHLKHCLD